MHRSIQLHHGDGGHSTSQLIQEVFYKYFYNSTLINSKDAAVLTLEDRQVAFTTDSFVVKPIIFEGGNIGKLAACGTINDLVAVGAKPLYLSVGFIIEEGFSIELLEKISHSMGKVCKDNDVMIVTGDTKVVEKGAIDGIFINTSGIGIVDKRYTTRSLSHGDEILITGGIAEHGTVILKERYNLQIEDQLKSDCTPLCSILSGLRDELRHIKLMRDPTRGGLATALCDIAAEEKIGMLIEEEKIPINCTVQGIHKILGTDPLYFASEGRMIIVVESGYGEQLKQKLQSLPIGKDTKVIGECIKEEEYMVKMKTGIGGLRIITSLANQIIPRIC